MSKRFPTRSKYWTLGQALAWVIYRREDVVTELAPQSGRRLSLISMFPSMYCPELEPVGSSEELLQHLREGALTASGRPAGDLSIRQDIRPEDWVRLRFLGEHAWRASEDGQRTVEPWHDIVLEGAEVRKRFRGLSELDARTKFDWTVIRKIHDEVLTRLPQISQNELIAEIQGQFRDQFNKEPPGRTSIQTRIQRWRANGQ